MHFVDQLLVHTAGSTSSSKLGILQAARPHPRVVTAIAMHNQLHIILATGQTDKRFAAPDAFASRWAPKLLLVLVGEVPMSPLGGLLPSNHPTEFPGGLLPCSALPFLQQHLCLVNRH